MRAFVTGGTGFIGSNLVANLNQIGIDVRILSRASSSHESLDDLTYETAIGDILGEQKALATAMDGCDWVFHCAGATAYWRRKDPKWLYKVNVEGTKNVLKAAQEAGVERFVLTSSLGALGVPQPGEQLNESSQFNLVPEQYPYGHSKHLAEIELQRAVDAGLPAIIVNPASIIGPRDVNQLGGAIIVEAAKGRLRVCPPGGLNFVAVEDTVIGHIAAAEQGVVGQRYILAGNNLSYWKAATVVCEVVGRPSPAMIIPKRLVPLTAAAIALARMIWGNRVPLDANQARISAAYIYADGQKAFRELQIPRTPFRTSVRRAYTWYVQHGYI